MIAQWTLNVEGFGKIEKASVRISPFMIFAGDNNSGKSYMMSLLWGILMIDEVSVSLSDIKATDIYKKCYEWLTDQPQDKEGITLTHEEIQMFFELFNTFLDSHKNHLVKHIFNADIPIKSISLSDLHYDIPVVVYPTKHPFAWGQIRLGQPKYKLVISTDNVEELDDILFYLCAKIVLGNLSDVISGGVHYLPASRTGFMLTYKALAQKAVRHGFLTHQKDDSSRMGKLTAPVSHFLSDLVGLNFDENNPYLPVSQFLEEHVLQGKIEKDQSPVPNYFFKPDHLEEELSLHVTSSLVAELSPIVMYCKSDQKVQTLIIEEPEAHLHLDMQRNMARALVRLVNMGLPVWITTHSDTMVQQINNLIKLNNHSNQEELADQYGYEEIDFLDADKVRVYQFNTQPRKTEVHLQPLTSNGFSLPTFSESIRKLTKETIDLMESDDDEKDD